MPELKVEGEKLNAFESTEFYDSFNMLFDPGYNDTPADFDNMNSTPIEQQFVDLVQTVEGTVSQTCSSTEETYSTPGSMQPKLTSMSQIGMKREAQSPLLDCQEFPTISKIDNQARGRSTAPRISGSRDSSLTRMPTLNDMKRDGSHKRVRSSLGPKAPRFQRLK
jgi:hypothetical protein